MLDHVIVDVADLEASREFYERALAPLGVSLTMEFGDMCAFGTGNAGPHFWIAARATGGATGVHVAFAAASRDAVDAFHEAALAAGATDNGPPGFRPQYHASYYAAFVLDRDGNNIEAVTHATPE